MNWKRLIPPALIAVAIIAYANSFAGVFLLDDDTAIVRQKDIARLWPPPLRMRALVDLTFRLNYRLSGLKTADYHAANVLIHLLAGLTLFGVIRRTLLLPRLGGRYSEASAAGLAGVSAAVWLAHPLQTESVTYICQRYESMMGLFALLSLYAFARAAGETRRERLWYDVSLAACAAGMASKETMLFAPVVMLLYDRLLLARSFRELLRARGKVHASLLLTCLIVPVLFCFDASASLKSGQPFGMLPSLSPLSYLRTQMGVIAHYLKLAFVPWPLCLDYGWPAAQRLTDVLLPAVPVGLLLAATGWAAARRLPVAFLGVWFFGTLAPSSSLFPVADFAFEHRMYLPLAAIVVAVALAAHAGLRRWAAAGARAARAVRVAAVAGTAALLAVLIGLTLRRNADYASETAMWRSVLAVRPDNLRARNDLATAYAQGGKATEAAREFDEVLARIPAKVRRPLDAGQVHVTGGFANNSYAYNYFWAHANLGLLMFKERGDDADAIAHYVAALRVAPYHPGVREKLKAVLRNMHVAERDLDTEIERLLRDGKR